MDAELAAEDLLWKVERMAVTAEQLAENPIVMVTYHPQKGVGFERCSE